MGWFKFLIYFALWAGALLNIANGIMQITGYIYLQEGVEPEIVYRAFPDLKFFDVLFGFATCLLGIFVIVTRFSLAKFKVSGPIMLYAVHVFVIILNLLNNGIRTSITGANATGTILGSLIGGVIIIAIHVKYFNNRKHLFIN